MKKKTTKIKVAVKGKPEKRTFKHFLIATGIILLPLAVGLVASALTGNTMMEFGRLKQPPLAPPAWLFPVAWTILYILMGVASYLIYRLNPKTKAEKKLQTAELIIYFVQLFFNFMWTIFFFRLEMRWFAFGWLIVMWLMILALICMCAKNRKAAAWCLVPYLLWCTFASYLNIMIAILN
ncbi:tryptophan-rich sensory protein [Candidatus Saccharibacteria bacterium]|nr:tryptophan-rich sensory protein [Candidatus Saccharibacteria bacterium]